jgi:hypothetical protein
VYILAVQQTNSITTTVPQNILFECNERVQLVLKTKTKNELQLFYDFIDALYKILFVEAINEAKVFKAVYAFN